MPDVLAYATVDDLRDAWSGYGSSMQPQAIKLLGYAAALINNVAQKNGVDVETIDATLKELVSVDMVRMALLADDRESPDAKQEENIAGPYTRNVVYFGLGGIWMTDQQLDTLGLGKTQKLGIISPQPKPSFMGRFFGGGRWRL